MSKIHEIELEDGTIIYVESEEVDVPVSRQSEEDDDLPEGVEEVGYAEKMVATGKMIRKTVGSMAGTIKKGMDKVQPDEWTMELNIAFKGKTTLVPVLVGGESNVALKVSAKWVRQQPTPDADTTQSSKK